MLTQARVTANASTKVRRVVENGREYLVAPLTLIVPGVLSGSQGALYYPPEEVAAKTGHWDRVPITVRHPFHPVTNAPLSASSKGVWERQGIGEVRKPRFSSKLQAEGWFDVERIKKVDARILNSLRSGQAMELSTGLFTENEPRAGVASGRAFDAIARNHRPDHLAVLPDEVGACSVKDGCGVLVNKKEDSAVPDKKSIWARLGEALGVTDNAQKHLETGQFLPQKGSSKKQLDRAAQKGHKDTDVPFEKPGDDDLEVEETPEDGRGKGKVTAEEPVTANGLDAQGGAKPTLELPMLQKADFVTLPNGIPGTNCSNCRFVGGKDGAHYCENDSLKGQSVTPRNCCAYWDANGTLRDWKSGDATENQLTANEFASDEQRQAFFGLLVSGKVGGSDAEGDAKSAAAMEKTKSANKGSRASGHENARDLHLAAAAHHEGKGNKEKAEQHLKLAEHHESKMKNATRNAQGDSSPMSVKKLDRKTMIAKLTANCRCSEEKTAISKLTDSTLKQLYDVRNALPAKGGDDEDDDDDSDVEDSEVEDSEVEEAPAKKGPPMKGKGPPAPAANKQKTAQEWLAEAPEDIRAAVVNSLKRDQEEKKKLVLTLTANMEDGSAKTKRQSLLMKMPIEDSDITVGLRSLAANSAPSNKPRQGGLASIFAGLDSISSESPVGNSEDDKDDVLELPTMNWREIAKSN